MKDEELSEVIEGLLKDANLEEVTMNKLCEQVAMSNIIMYVNFLTFSIEVEKFSLQSSLLEHLPAVLLIPVFYEF